MQLYRIQSTLVSLLEFDAIPIFKLVSSSQLQQDLDSRYSFQSHELGLEDGRPVLSFDFGTVLDGQDEIALLRLRLEERKITCVMESGKDQIDAFYKDLTSLLMQHSQRNDPTAFDPIIMVDDSEIVAQLDIEAESFFSPKLLDALKADVVPELQLEGTAAARVSPRSVSFEVDYYPNDRVLQENKIGLTRKELILQPRPGRPLEDRVFLSKMPVNSNTHIKLLEQLESALQ